MSVRESAPPTPMQRRPRSTPGTIPSATVDFARGHSCFRRPTLSAATADCTLTIWNEGGHITGTARCRGDCGRLAGETSQQKLAFRYILALMLARKKLLVLENKEKDSAGNDVLIYRDKREAATHPVVEPPLSEAEIPEGCYSPALPCCRWTQAKGITFASGFLMPSPKKSS